MDDLFEVVGDALIPETKKGCLIWVIILLVIIGIVFYLNSLLKPTEVVVKGKYSDNYIEYYELDSRIIGSKELSNDQYDKTQVNDTITLDL